MWKEPSIKMHINNIKDEHSLLHNCCPGTPWEGRDYKMELLNASMIVEMEGSCWDCCQSMDLGQFALPRWKLWATKKKRFKWWYVAIVVSLGI